MKETKNWKGKWERIKKKYQDKIGKKQEYIRNKKMKRHTKKVKVGQ